VLEALRRLALRGWTRLASGPGGRARKYRHLLDQALDLDPGGLSLLAVLMLRGPQTPGELKQRTARMHPFADLDAVQGALEQLVEAGHVARQPRRPGQKEERFEQLLGDDAEDVAEAPAEMDRDGLETPPAEGSLGSRLTRLEGELASLRQELASLRDSLGG
jgi:uncharacterized protein YceH (UPF0502 family)